METLSSVIKCSHPFGDVGMYHTYAVPTVREGFHRSIKYCRMEDLRRLSVQTGGTGHTTDSPRAAHCQEV